MILSKLDMCVQLDVFCFTQSIYVLDENSNATLTAELSRPLQEDIAVKFAYINITANGKLLSQKS